MARAKPKDGFTDMGQAILKLRELGRVQVGHDTPGALGRLRLGHQQSGRRVGEQLADVDLEDRTLADRSVSLVPSMARTTKLSPS